MGLTNLTDFINKWGIWLFVGLFTYWISFCLVYKWMQKAYSKGGVFQRQYPSIWTLFFCIVPVFNTVFAVMNFFYRPIRKEENPEGNKLYNNFFNIKK